MKKLLIIFCLYIFVNLHSQIITTPDYTITTGKIPNILRDNDVKRQFEIMELEEFVNWLKSQSQDITEGAVISEERLKNLLMSNYSMKKKVVNLELKKYHRPMLKYITHHYQKNWVKEWMVFSRIEKDIMEEAVKEMEEAVDEMEGEEGDVGS